MTDIQDTPSIVDRDITRFRGGQVLRYADLTGREKRDYLFDDGIRATAYANGLPDVHLGLFAATEAGGESLAHHLLRETVTRVGDELETPKHKLFHSFGTTAKIRFTPESSTPYTGIFQDTAHGLARFSYAGPVIGIGIVPGLGLKFLVDGDQPSENVVVMRMLDPQAEHSVFHNPFTNILPGSECPQPDHAGGERTLRDGRRGRPRTASTGGQFRPDPRERAARRWSTESAVSTHPGADRRRPKRVRSAPRLPRRPGPERARRDDDLFGARPRRAGGNGAPRAGHADSGGPDSARATHRLHHDRVGVHRVNVRRLPAVLQTQRRLLAPEN